MYYKRAKLLTLYLLMVIGIISGGARADEERPSEYQVKAAFVYNFAKFVEWPVSAFRGPADSITIGVVGETGNGFEEALEQTIRGKTINGRHLEKRHVNSPEDVGNCQIIFFCRLEKKAFGDFEKGRQIKFLRLLEKQSVLTVGETDWFLHNGGVINFIVEEGKVRFDIDKSKAQKLSLKISSKLLNLAKNRGVVP
ncbi:YfiR family protein [Pedosphaera parvula]|uniref:Putative transmembrane protein n=1 Tax=Pedosphaera parvula (strain Ellin514) TaxID=320771 RepID=B9XIB5_PEDPL|nr:YfiR family protein [Pedosphaera parvula]EEF60376.1 putative transmembrane protein [Pedosphaera parvula Ellin514]